MELPVVLILIMLMTPVLTLLLYNAAAHNTLCLGGGRGHFHDIGIVALAFMFIPFAFRFLFGCSGCFLMHQIQEEEGKRKEGGGGRRREERRRGLSAVLTSPVAVGFQGVPCPKWPVIQRARG
jgi:hypothetical protein